ncbi:hypothetical protein D4759_15065 [Clostridiales bacterium AHG0011]|nr:hypothetical protein [Clostridiales bacterium AHG0011]
MLAHWAFHILWCLSAARISINPPRPLLSYAYKCYPGDISGFKIFGKIYIIYSWEKVGDI